MNNIKYLAIGGGGIFGLKYLGILSNYNLSNVKSYCGSSIGGLICYMLSIGYTCEELYKKVIEIDKELKMIMDFTEQNTLTLTRIKRRFLSDKNKKVPI